MGEYGIERPHPSTHTLLLSSLCHDMTCLDIKETHNKHIIHTKNRASACKL